MDYFKRLIGNNTQPSTEGVETYGHKFSKDENPQLYDLESRAIELKKEINKRSNNKDDEFFKLKRELDILNIEIENHIFHLGGLTESQTESRKIELAKLKIFLRANLWNLFSDWEQLATNEQLRLQFVFNVLMPMLEKAFLENLFQTETFTQWISDFFLKNKEVKVDIEYWTTKNPNTYQFIYALPYVFKIVEAKIIQNPVQEQRPKIENIVYDNVDGLDIERLLRIFRYNVTRPTWETSLEDDVNVNIKRLEANPIGKIDTRFIKRVNAGGVGLIIPSGRTHHYLDHPNDNSVFSDFYRRFAHLQGNIPVKLHYANGDIEDLEVNLVIYPNENFRVLEPGMPSEISATSALYDQLKEVIAITFNMKHNAPEPPKPPQRTTPNDLFRT